MPDLVDAYIAGFPPGTQQLLQEIRALIRAEAPQAVEKISYGMPTLYLRGNLVHFAAYPGHIGFYPTPSAILAFESELKVYTHAKGSVRFPLDQPLPRDLIQRMVRFRVAEILGTTLPPADC